MEQRPVDPKLRAFAKHLRREQTGLEGAVWRELRAKRLDGWKFKRQVPIAPFVVDFVYLEARLIVEIDGPLHDDLNRKNRDAARDQFLGEQGFCVLRFDQDRVLGDLARVIESIRRALGPSPDP